MSTETSMMQEMISTQDFIQYEDIDEVDIIINTLSEARDYDMLWYLWMTLDRPDIDVVKNNKVTCSVNCKKIVLHLDSGPFSVIGSTSNDPSKFYTVDREEEPTSDECITKIEEVTTDECVIKREEEPIIVEDGKREDVESTPSDCNFYIVKREDEFKVDNGEHVYRLYNNSHLTKFKKVYKEAHKISLDLADNLEVWYTLRNPDCRHDITRIAYNIKHQDKITPKRRSPRRMMKKRSPKRRR